MSADRFKLLASITIETYRPSNDENFVSVINVHESEAQFRVELQDDQGIPIEGPEFFDLYMDAEKRVIEYMGIPARDAMRGDDDE